MGIGVILARQISRMREMTRRWGVEFTSILLGILVMNTLLSYPHYLSFFNLIAGGRENGHRVLNDSNLDWGQDLKRLRGSLDANPPAEPIYLIFWRARCGRILFKRSSFHLAPSSREYSFFRGNIHRQRVLSLATAICMARFCSALPNDRLEHPPLRFVKTSISL